MFKHKTIIKKRSQHNISRKNIDKDALNVIKRLNRHGYRAYLVGGGVRDLLLERQPKDFDISTDAKPNQIKKLFRNCFLVGRRFRLAHIRFGYHKIIETSTFRRQPDTNADSDDPNACLMQKNDNAFGTPEEDARRRDFTINGLFYDLNDFSIIDHVGGLSDLKKGIVRCIGDPDIRFREDPVRMMRAVRFASRLGFRIETKTYKAITKHFAEITKSPPARLLEEVYRLFAFNAAEPAFFLLWKTNLISVLFPEVDAYLKNNGKENATLWRFLAALDSGEHFDREPTSALMLATLLCDPIAQRVKTSDTYRNYAEYASLMEDLVAPIAARYKIPKRVKYRLIRILADQYRLDEALVTQSANRDGRRRRGASPSRIASQESFPEALALLEIRAAAGCVDPEIAAYWRKLSETVEVIVPPRKPRPQKRGGRGNRYGGRRRKSPRSKVQTKQNHAD